MKLEDYFDFEPLSFKYLKSDHRPELYGDFSSFTKDDYSLTIYIENAELRPNNTYVMATTLNACLNPHQPKVTGVYWENETLYVYVESAYDEDSTFVKINKVPEEVYHEALRIASIDPVKIHYSEL